jgi:hypothetical protein
MWWSLPFAMCFFMSWQGRVGHTIRTLLQVQSVVTVYKAKVCISTCACLPHNRNTRFLLSLLRPAIILSVNGCQPEMNFRWWGTSLGHHGV